MDTFKARFPARQETWLTFSSIIFVINVWAIINILRAVPSWILSRTIWEMIGIISYPLAFALIESLIFLVGLIFLAVILPKRVMREKFVGTSSLSALIATLGMVIAHLYGKELGIWSVRDFGWYLLILLGVVIVSWILVSVVKQLNDRVEDIAGRLTPLSTLYLVLDVAGLMIVIARNV